MITSVFHIADMHCSSCESRISKALDEIPGIGAVRANPTRRELFVEHDVKQVAVLDVFGRIEALGFSPMLDAETDTASLRQDIKRLGVAAIGMMQVVMQAIAMYVGDAQDMAFEHVRLFQLASFVITLPVIAYSAQPFFHNAWQSLRAVKRPGHVLSVLSMDVPVSLALIVAFCASTLTLIRGEGDVYFDSIVMFTFLLLTARLISNGLSRKQMATSVMSLLPQRCTVVTDQGDREVALESLNVGQRVLVRPGERVVADGTIVSGSAHLDEALLSGESDAVTKEVGDNVTAGTMNLYQSFEFDAEAVGSDLRLATIERLATESMHADSSESTLASRVAGYFVFAMLLVAATTLLFWLYVNPEHALSATIAVLVVSCPCALALAMPAAITAAMSRLQSYGMVVSDSDVLRKAAAIHTLAVDKTGTLTTGQLKVKDCVLLGALSERDCRSLAAGCERASNHPIARAFHREVFESANVGADDRANGPDADSHSDQQTDRERGANELLSVDQVCIDRLGISGRCRWGQVKIGTVSFCTASAQSAETSSTARQVWLSVNDELVARFDLEEEVRPDAESTLDELKRAGLSLMLLSGDKAHNCAEFSQQLPLYAELSPEEKKALIRDTQGSRPGVMMLGDGINDLPAMSEATLAAAVLEAPDVVQSKCDVLLVSRRLGPLVELINTARRTQAITRQNVTWAVTYNAIMIPLAASGQLAPWMAALGMSLSSILVVANSSRLQSRKV